MCYQRERLAPGGARCRRFERPKPARWRRAAVSDEPVLTVTGARDGAEILLFDLP